MSCRGEWEWLFSEMGNNLCISQGGDCAELMKSFEECMNKAAQS